MCMVDIRSGFCPVGNYENSNELYRRAGAGHGTCRQWGLRGLRAGAVQLPVRAWRLAGPTSRSPVPLRVENHQRDLFLLFLQGRVENHGDLFLLLLQVRVLLLQVRVEIRPGLALLLQQRAAATYPDD